MDWVFDRWLTELIQFNRHMEDDDCRRRHHRRVELNPDKSDRWIEFSTDNLLNWLNWVDTWKMTTEKKEEEHSGMSCNSHGAVIFSCHNENVNRNRPEQHFNEDGVTRIRKTTVSWLVLVELGRRSLIECRTTCMLYLYMIYGCLFGLGVSRVASNFKFNLLKLQTLITKFSSDTIYSGAVKICFNCERIMSLAQKKK